MSYFLLKVAYCYQSSHFNLFKTVCLKFVMFVVIVWDFFENAPKWCDLRDQDAHFDLDMIEFKKKKKGE